MYYQSLEIRVTQVDVVAVRIESLHVFVYCSGASILSIRSQQRVRNTRQRCHSQVQHTELCRGIRSGRWLARRSGKFFRSRPGQRYKSNLLGNSRTRVGSGWWVNVVGAAFCVMFLSCITHFTRIFVEINLSKDFEMLSSKHFKVASLHLNGWNVYVCWDI